MTYDKEGKASFLVQSRSLQSVSGGETVITEQLASKYLFVFASKYMFEVASLCTALTYNG